MKTRKNLFDLFSELEDQFEKNPDTVFRRLELLKDGKNDALIEELKTKFIGKLIDAGIHAVPVKSAATTVPQLLEELETVLKEKGIKLGSYGNGKFYHPDVLGWFPNAKVAENSPEMIVPFLPKGGMTEGEMIAEAKSLKKVYEHHLSDYIRNTIALVKNNFFAKKDTWAIGFLTEKKDGSVPCLFCALLYSGGKFCLIVRLVRESDRWSAGDGFFLSN